MSTKSNDAKKFLGSLIKGTPTFGKLLSALRECDEISQAELARKANVSRGLICDIEKGRRDASIEIASRLAKIMGYPQESFLSILIEEQMKKVHLNYKVTLDKVA